MIPEFKEPKLTITTYLAVLVYFIFSIFIWFPVGLLMSLVNPKLTIMIFVMYFVKEVSRMYLGIKA